MTLAYIISMKSKDPSTRVGAIIINKDKTIISTGYNGLPRNIKDNKARYLDKNYKYLSTSHAEENAILNCARIGISTIKCTIYTPWMPCISCAKIIIQSGITTLIYDGNFPGNTEYSKRWQDNMKVSKELLLESGVKIKKYTGNLINITGLYDGRPFSRL